MSTRSSPTTSTTGSQQRSSDAVRRAAVITHGKPADDRAGSRAARESCARGGRRAAAARTRRSRSTASASRSRISRAPTSPSSSAATGRCCARCSVFSERRSPSSASTSAASGSSPRSSRTSSSPASSRVFSGDYRVVHLTTLEVEVDGVRGAAINDVVVLSSIRGPDGRALVGARRRGHGRAAVRRDDLREPGGVDCLQPFERRPRSGARARRDGGHVHRPAFAARAPDRRSSRASTSRSAIRRSTWT